MTGFEPQTSTDGATITTQALSKAFVLVLSSITSVTRFGDFLDFGQLFKSFGNN